MEVKAAEGEYNFNLTTDNAYLALTDVLWGGCSEDFGEKWPRYNDTALYPIAPNHNKDRNCALSLGRIAGNWYFKFRGHILFIVILNLYL